MSASFSPRCGGDPRQRLVEDMTVRGVFEQNYQYSNRIIADDATFLERSLNRTEAEDFGRDRTAYLMHLRLRTRVCEGCLGREVHADWFTSWPEACTVGVRMEVAVAGKVVVLKPMAWNDNGYVRPDGNIRKTGYVSQSGFGHEEWNGNSTRMWNGERVFHTESTKRMSSWAAEGELGIIMTAYKDGTPYALGVATSVRANSDSDKAAIFRALRLSGEVDYLWGLPSVKARHPNKAALQKRWTEEGAHNNWRCPPSEFMWFENPVELDADRLFPPAEKGGKAPDIIKMHGRFMAIRQDQALSIVKGSLDSGSPILDWLSNGDFDQKAISEKTKAYRKPSPGVPTQGGRSAAPPDKGHVRYVAEYEVRVHPRHFNFQAEFRTFISATGATNIKENTGAIDIQFALPEQGHIIAELKPCITTDVRYAIRTAMGQLLDYQHRHHDRAALLVVVEVSPNAKDVDLALSNGFGIAYPHRGGFVLKWPA